MVREEISAQESILLLPGFPVALVVVDTNILTVAATSFFSFQPPMIMIGIVPTRYSYELIQEVGDYSFNIPGKELLSAVKFCGTRSGRDFDKFKETQLTPEAPQKIKSSLIGEALVSLECKIVKSIEVQNATHVWYIGEIVAAYKRKDYEKTQAILYWPREYRFIGELIK